MEYIVSETTKNALAVLLREPAVCIGRGWYDPGAPRDNKNHTPEENFPIRNAYKAVQAVFLTTMMAAGTENTESIV